MEGTASASNAKLASAPSEKTGAKSERKACDRRVVRTRKAIRTALLHLMEQQDYHKITIAAVAREADIDRKTFYLHYDSVEAVVEEMVQEEATRLVEACRNALFGGDEAIDVQRAFEELSLGIAPSLTQARDMVEHISLEDLLERLEKPLTEGIIEADDAHFKALGPYLPFCVAFFSAGLISVYRRWLLTESELPLQDVADITRLFVFKGVDGVKEAVNEAPA